jgi:hypothetical protein
MFRISHKNKTTPDGISSGGISPTGYVETPQWAIHCASAYAFETNILPVFPPPRNQKTFFTCSHRKH